MREEVIDYQVEGKTFKGLLVYDENDQKTRPGVIVVHAYKGQDRFAQEKARELVRLGYTAFAADYYGEGKTVATDDEAKQLMRPLFIDRTLLRKRIVGAFEVFKKQKQADPQRIGAIGFCFGGLTAIELLRSGVGVRGIVSFHGIFGSRMGEMQAQLAPNHYIPGTSLLALNGYDDPMLPESDVSAIQKEFNAANIDWQMNIYGHTKHAFMVPEANEGALKYNPVVCKRAWAAMELFFKEIFS